MTIRLTLTQMLESDLLEIYDEAHRRNLHGDDLTTVLKLLEIQSLRAIGEQLRVLNDEGIAKRAD